MVDHPRREEDSPATSGPPAAARFDVSGLVAEYYSRVYRYAYRLCGNAADAEDLTQQTFLVVQNKLHQVREVEKVQSWIFTVLRTVFLKSRRRQRPVAAASLELDVEAVPETRLAPSTLDQQDLQQALNDLPEEFRLVVLMFYFEEQSYQEIAQELSLPIGTVMSRLSRAKARLRRLFDMPADPNAAGGTTRAGASPDSQSSRP